LYYNARKRKYNIQNKIFVCKQKFRGQMKLSDGNTKKDNKRRGSGSVKCKWEMRVKKIIED